MYKVIFLSMAFENPRDQHNFSLLDESFDIKGKRLRRKIT